MPTNPLRLWLSQHPQGLQAARAELAAQLDRHPTYVRSIDSGYDRPSWDLAFRLEELTGASAKILRNWPLRRPRGGR